MLGRVLVVAGSDSGGGAGIQADIKAIQAQGAYASTALTALTAQNTFGVQSIYDVSESFVGAQIDAVLSDIGADIVKTGMLARRAVIEQIAARIDALPSIIDPVMVATSGDILLAADAIEALQSLLLRTAFVATPNLPEASLLMKRDIETLDDMRRAADYLMNNGAHAALIKGGHGTGAMVQDLLAMQSGQHIIEHPRIESANTHGTGCSLASALAANLAQVIAKNATRPRDAGLLAATQKSLDYIHAAITTAPQTIGKGKNKPLNHLPK